MGKASDFFTLPPVFLGEERESPPDKGQKAAVRNLWPEGSTEPHAANITFGQNQVDFSTLASTEGLKVQTPDQSHAPSDAPENFTPHAQTAAAGGTNHSWRRTKVPTAPAGPERATALTSPSSTSALGRLPLPASSPGSEGRGAPSHPESRPSWGFPAREKGLPKEVTVQTPVATSVLSQSSRPALETGEEASVSRKGNSSEPEPSWLLFSRTSASFPPSGHSTASGSMEELNNSTAPQSPSVSWAKSVQVATTFPNGVPRETQSVAVSVGWLNETEGFSEDAEVAPTSASVHSSPSEAELRRNTGITRSLGDGKFSESSTENGFGLTSSEVAVGFWQNDSPVPEGPPQASGSDKKNGSPMSRTESVAGSVPLGGAGESTAHWILTNSKTFEDVTGSSTSYPGVVNSSVLTQFSASAPQPRGSDTVLGGGSDAELATESSSSSSSESLESSAPRGERSTTEDSPELGVGADTQQGSEGTPGARAHSPHTSATFTGNGERTLRSVTNQTSGDEGRSQTAPREAESATPHGNVTAAATSTRLARTPPAWTATTPKTPPPPVPTPGPSSSTATPLAGPAAAQTTAGKRFLPTSPEMPAPRISTEVVVTTKRSRAPVGDTTRWSSLTSAPTSATVLTTGPGVSEGDSPAPPFLRTSPSPRSTDASPAEVSSPRATTSRAQSGTQSPPRSSPASVNSCAPNPCLHDGKCVVDPARRGYRCVCSPSWQGKDCSVDVNECLSNPCPPLAVCNNTQGSFTCRCPIGYQLEKGICNLVRTFVTEFKLKKTFPNSTVEKHSDLHEVENEVTKTLNMCFSMLPGYTRSTVRASGESSAVVLSLQTTFSLASNVTLFDLADGMQRCANSCRSSAEVCQLLGSQRRIFRAGSLCKRKTPECDKETSVCTDLDGVALCQCKSGYFQFNKMDHSCRACEDGYRLENETCMSCPFGLGGLNCGNPYQLITVVIAAAGGGLLLILGIALIVTCCRKNKNDISKLIFKSGDFQMSPYAEYPKNPRSQEWGREAIEMHENGSTKNLLQMTDVYYSPTNVRNPELERNGLYPAYTGLPGSRHSCIFPGQYNPSFISDESRRRDYF
ncbi:Protein HEG like protein 1 [Myotis brandtii]|uniref:Protein HEG like protein 1 n=1 Tax=Myotis brandtii TaxID=109478 RepID=S7N7C0_MYOBR|nr:Protein HEG like protein 1 [Myotis brandtii]